MTEQLPEPLVPAEVDLRDMDGFMLNVERLLASELWAISTGEEFKAAMGLWARAWKQTPAASLPNDDRVLSSFAGVPMPRWKKVREMAMRGFVLCTDGRFYHKVLADDAKRAWARKESFRDRGRRGNERRWKGGADGDVSDAMATGGASQTGERRGSHGDDQTIAEPSQKDRAAIAKGSHSNGSATGVAILNDRQGQGHKEERAEAPLPPRSNSHAANGVIPASNLPAESEIEKEAKSFNHAFFAIREIEFGGPPEPESYPAKDLSVARGWIERGVEFYPFRELLEQQMRRMAKANKPPPSSLWFFNRSVDEAIASDWQGYRE